MVFLTTKVMQRTALFVTFGGLVTCLITTFLPLWKTMNSDLNEVENWFSGLWHTCLYTEEVGIQCKAYDSIMGLPMDLQISRVLMSVSISTGGLALLAVFPGLEGVEVCAGQPGLKRRFLILGGVLSWVSGLSTLYAEAMFSGWFGGLALVIGGTLFFVAVCMGDFDQRPPSVPNRELLDGGTATPRGCTPLCKQQF
uniref:Claudin n=1 Tax=Mola mola TaxID=94237 RepID=A0A3Q3X5I7_MOLML